MRQDARTQRTGKCSTTRLGGALSLIVVILVMLLSGCSPSTPNYRAVASRNQTKLDAALHTAEQQDGIPAIILQPFEQQESALAAGMASGSDRTGKSAADGFAKLYDQVVVLEKLTPEEIDQRATGELQSFTATLQKVQAQGFVEASTFQAHLSVAQKQLAAAKTAKDYFAAEGYILDQASAVSRIIPDYQALQTLDTMVSAQSTALGSSSPQPLECALGDDGSFFVSDADILSNVGLNPSSAVMVGSGPKFEFQSWPAQDLAVFRSGQNSADYTALESLIQSQMVQLTADSATLLPQQTAAAVKQYQSDVATFLQDGGTDASFQQQATQDARSLASATSLAALSALEATVQKQQQAFALPLAKAEAQHDLQTLTNLVLQADSKTTVDPYDGVAYPDGYEYLGIDFENGRDWAADSLDKYDTENYQGGTALGDARARVANAQTVSDYTTVDSEIQMFITNIQAMLTNLAQMPSDTAARQAWSMTSHPADTNLIDHYGLQNTKVIVVSLREQKMRLYDNGKLVVGSDGKPEAFDVTTGNPDLPSVPGVHCITEKLQNYEDKSPFPKDSPYYYNPTHVNFGMVYSDYGYLIHDAWWRDTPSGDEMGYLTNLPHYDPIAFNSGSHGCINTHFDNGDMETIFNFADIGTPVIVY